MALPILDGNQSATTLSTILSGGEHTPAHTVVSLGSTAISNITSAVSGSVVSISNFPATQNIAGTVTANLGPQPPVYEHTQVGADKCVLIGTASYEEGQVHHVSPNHPVPISGTVTANVFGPNGGQALAIGEDGNPFGSGSGRLMVELVDLSGNTIAQNNILPISGTVTVGAVPNGSLTTRFGTPTTANTAFATSAVTNASRKYLLIQNVTTGSNVITVGIGFTPTTTQGIQLTAGAGITFESSYIPTGAVRILSSVTASNFTILEA